MFGKSKTSPSHNVLIREGTRKRVRSMGGDSLDLQLDLLLNSSLPEAYSLWRKGTAGPTEVELALEAVLAVWDELATRQDQYL